MEPTYNEELRRKPRHTYKQPQSYAERTSGTHKDPQRAARTEPQSSETSTDVDGHRRVQTQTPAQPTAPIDTLGKHHGEPQGPGEATPKAHELPLRPPRKHGQRHE